MAHQSLSQEEQQRLIAAAEAAMQRAYAPYSKFRVGAAVLTTSGKVYAGCNVENASYGLTNCAERTAIFSAVAAEGEDLKVRAVAVSNANRVACSPCGACRQVIFEFGPEATVIFQGTRGYVTKQASELLPAGFSLL
ncbi:MAG TPA: cytidine deaminase [Terriglobales bacterium]|nr:cytidine deaminase [Terriglobales bacterium]